MNHRNQSQRGFTLVELMLSMGFIAVLLLAVAMLVLQISSIYNKGVTLRAVNDAGQTITTDIQRTLNTSNPRITKQAKDAGPSPTGGRLCAGNIVYAWNFGKYLQDSSAFNRDPSGETDIRLVKFTNSATSDFCTEVDGDYPMLPDVDTMTSLLKSGTSDRNLALHTFTISDQEVSGDSAQRMYQITMVIGTNETSVIDGNGCSQPVSQVDDEYCAVNEFSFTARAGNK